MIYYFMLNTQPRPDSPEWETSDGAFVNCWVLADSQTAALVQASRFIEGQGWAIQGIEQQFIADRERYVDDDELPESLEAFDQAMRDGIAVVVYRWSEEQADEG